MQKLHTSYSNVVLWRIRPDNNGLRIYCSLRNLFVTLAIWWAGLAGFCYLFLKIMDNTSYNIAVILFCVLIAMVQGILIVPRYVIDKRKGDYLILDCAERCVRLPHLKKEIYWDTTRPIFRFDYYRAWDEGYSEFNVQRPDGRIFPILKLIGIGCKFSGVNKKLQTLGFEVQEHRHNLSESQ